MSNDKPRHNLNPETKGYIILLAGIILLPTGVIIYRGSLDLCAGVPCIPPGHPYVSWTGITLIFIGLLGLVPLGLMRVLDARHEKETTRELSSEDT